MTFGRSPGQAAPGGALLLFAYTGTACAEPRNTSGGECLIADKLSGYSYSDQLPPYGQNYAFRSTDDGDSWAMASLDSNPTRAGGPLHAAMNIWNTAYPMDCAGPARAFRRPGLFS